MAETEGRRRCAPGSWYAVFGDRVSVLLPPSQRARVPALWELADDGAGFDEVLDRLLASGLRDLPGFALVGETAEGPTRVVVRGEARARLDTAEGEVRLDGAGEVTWIERAVEDVRGYRLEVEPPEGAPDLSLSSGVTRVATVTVGAPALPGRAAGDRAPASAAPAPPAADPSPHPADHDGRTRHGASRATAPAPPTAGDVVARLVLPAGEVVDVDEVVLVGRAPRAERRPGEPEPRLVAVASPGQEVSATHLELRPGAGPDHGTAVATDLGSTNGTVLVQPGLPAEALVAGVAVSLVPGAVLDLGDGVAIRVAAASGEG